MEAKRTSQQVLIDRPQASSQGVIIRMGGKSWVVGEHGETLPLYSASETEKVISLSSLKTSELKNSNGKHESVLHRAKGRARGIWMAFHKKLEDKLDRLLTRGSAEAQTSERVERFKSRQENQIKKSSWMDGLRIGTIFGLALGCLGMILVHQVEPTTSRVPHVTQGGQTTVPSLPPAQPNSFVTVPSVHLYALELGPFKTEAEALAAQSIVEKKGYAQTLIHLNRRGWSVMNRVAVQAYDLGSVQAQFMKSGIDMQIHAINVDVRPISAVASTTASAQTISSWLSAEVAALNALTASASDGVSPTNATVALKAATALKPPVDSLSASGHGEDLATLASETSTMGRAIANHDGLSARHHALEAYSILLNLQ